MPTASRSRSIAAPPDEVWAIVADPHHLPRWWPKVARVEGVTDELWTQVLMTRKGKPVRADFRLLQSQPPNRQAWEQLLVGTPFERVLDESVTEIVLEAQAGGTLVTLAQRQKLKGYSRTGRFQLRRATVRILDEALDGLAGICGG
jgi:uncharacterized protein YndB with AHSA1/START domain